uniref:Aminotransferase-like plant mobile domain-containing protein n=1 Tax=Fagus sylvatica TaxID=28930 RepID=A0A2N9IUH0_FAGSY
MKVAHASSLTIISRVNPSWLINWSRRLSAKTRALVKIKGFKKFVELQPLEPTKKHLLYNLAERWWDTTHTFHISGSAGHRGGEDSYGNGLHFVVDRTALYNWGGVALANLYAGFDSVSREATTSFVGPWSIWQSWAFAYFGTAISWRSKAQMKEGLRKKPWALWVGAERVSPPIDDGRAMNVARFSRLYEGQGFHFVYMEERVIHQLGLVEELVHFPPLKFTLFSYEALDDIVQKWRDGLFYSKRLEANDDFEGY